MAKIVGQLKAVLGLDKSKYDKGLKSAKKGGNSFMSAMKKLGGVLAATFAVSKIVEFGKEVFNLAGKAQGVKAAFDQLNQPTLLEDLRKATRGTVDDLSLMQASVKAKNFKIPLNQLASYFEFATKRAAQTGESVDYLVQSIIDGVGRKSSMILDNLGISATQLQEEIKKTGDFGAAAGKIMTEELSKMGDVALTGEQKAAMLKSTWQNIKTEIGGALVPVIGDLAEKLSKALPGAIEWTKKAFNDVKRVTINVINYFIDLYNESLLFRIAVTGIKTAFKQMLTTVTNVFKIIKTNLTNAGKLIKAIFTGDFKAIKGILNQWGEDVKSNFKKFGKETAENYIDAYKTIQKRERIELIGKDEAKKQGIQAGQDFAKGFSAGSSSGSVPKPQDISAPGASDVSIGLGVSDEELEKLGLANAKMQEMVPTMQQLREQMSTTQVHWSLVAENMMMNASSMSDVMSSSINDLSNALGRGAQDFQTFAGNIKSTIKEIIGAFLAKAVATMISAGIQAAANAGPLALALAPALAAAGAGIAKTAFNSLVPNMRTGGIIPPGFSNDTYPAMLSSGEMVVPAPQKLPSAMGGGHLTAEVSGRKLRFILNQWDNDKQRIS
jgi:hypothetical protein